MLTMPTSLKSFTSTLPARFGMTRILGVAALTTALAACGVGGASSGEGSSASLRDLSQFNPETFNGGITFEQIVNPVYTRTGEHDGERVDPEHRDWLNAIDRFAEARESSNYVTMQDTMSQRRIKWQNTRLANLLARPATAKEGFSKAEAEKLYGALVTQRQVTDHGRFDPEISIGFCFGRAMIVHTFARQAFRTDEQGAKQSLRHIPVRKIWVTGPMDQWKHHVATLVLAQEADVGFWVVDNFVGEVMSIKDWKAYISDEFPDRNLLFNISRANRFSEANPLRYYEVLLDDPFFNGFFRDFLSTNVPKFLAAGGFDVTVPATATDGIAAGDGSASPESVVVQTRSALGGAADVGRAAGPTETILQP